MRLASPSLIVSAFVSLLACSHNEVTPCSQLTQCCGTLDNARRESCRVAHEGASQSPDPQASCRSALEQYQMQNECSDLDIPPVDQPGGEDCQDLRVCCDALADRTFVVAMTQLDGRERCLAVLDRAERNDSPRVSCAEATATLQRLEYCPTGDVEEDDPRAVCEHYLQCVTEAAPESLPTVLQTYGPSGHCWTSGDAAADACLSACRDNVARYQTLGYCGGQEPPEDELQGPPDWLLYDEVVFELCDMEGECMRQQGESEEQVQFVIQLCRANAQGQISHEDPMCSEDGQDIVDCRLQAECRYTMDCPLYSYECEGTTSPGGPPRAPAAR